ncbi:MAG: rhodanese-like domain-containing protein [Chloroflexota bacterium]|jgi:rhodanese-related sulfurtransferase
MGLFQSFFGRSSGSIAGVNAVELNDLLQDSEKDILLVDVRSPSEYVHDGHIEGAQLLPLQQLMQGAAELPREQEIVIVCRSGNRSMVACQQLVQMGFANVKNFNGGMIAWQMAGLPVSH